MDTDIDRKIPFPEGVVKFDPKEGDPVCLGLKSLCYGDRGEVIAVYEPGNVLVTFENGTDEFDVNDKATLSEKLDEVGILTAYLFNLTQQIEMLKDMLKLSDNFRKLLTGTAGLPTTSRFPTRRLGMYIRSAALSGGLIFGDDAFLKILKRERNALSEKLKSLGVKGVSCGGIQVMTSCIGTLEDL